VFAAARWNIKLRLRNTLIFWKHGTLGTQANSHSKQLQMLKRKCETSFKMHQRTGKSVRNTEGSNEVKQRLESREQVELWGWVSKASAELSKLEFPLPPKDRGLMGGPSRTELEPQRVTSQWKKDCTENCLYQIFGIKWRRVKSLDGPQTDDSPNSHIIKDTLQVDKKWSQNESIKCKKEWEKTSQ